MQSNPGYNTHQNALQSNSRIQISTSCTKASFRKTSSPVWLQGMGTHLIPNYVAWRNAYLDLISSMNFCSFNFLPPGHIMVSVRYLLYKKKLKQEKEKNLAINFKFSWKNQKYSSKYTEGKTSFLEELYEGPAAGWACHQLCSVWPGILAKLPLAGKVPQNGFCKQRFF